MGQTRKNTQAFHKGFEAAQQAIADFLEAYEPVELKTLGNAPVEWHVRDHVRTLAKQIRNFAPVSSLN